MRNLKVPARFFVIGYGSTLITPLHPRLHAAQSTDNSVLCCDICHKRICTIRQVCKCKPHKMAFDGIIIMEALSEMNETPTISEQKAASDYATTLKDITDLTAMINDLHSFVYNFSSDLSDAEQERMRLTLGRATRLLRDAETLKQTIEEYAKIHGYTLPEAQS